MFSKPRVQVFTLQRNFTAWWIEWFFQNVIIRNTVSIFGNKAHIFYKKKLYICNVFKQDCKTQSISSIMDDQVALVSNDVPLKIHTSLMCS